MQRATRFRLFGVIFLEGYVVLAAELLAMRLLIPFVGSGTEIIAIIISAVLLPLAIGYHHGGMARARLRATVSKYPDRKQPRTLRQLLLRNALTSLVILSFGLSHAVLEVFFGILQIAGLEHRLLLTLLYASLFLITPTYLLGQTVPIISHYFLHQRTETTTSRMLFFSTTGSFLGSVLSTLVLMSFVGVHWTAAITCALLGLLMLILARRPWDIDGFFAMAFAAFAIWLNSSYMLAPFHMISANAYNTVSINEDEKSIKLILNRSSASGLRKPDMTPYDYIQWLDEMFIDPTLNESTTAPKRILVLGAGGFTFGLKDTKNLYHFVDIDPDLKRVSEEHFLPSPLTPNKLFYPMSARAFLRQAKAESYDLILLDAYTNVMTIPADLSTREFFSDVKRALAPNGVVVSNVVAAPNFTDRFTTRYYNSFAAIFPRFTRQIISDRKSDGWQHTHTVTPNDWRNTLLIYYHTPEAQDNSLYTDLKNTATMDR